MKSVIVVVGLAFAVNAHAEWKSAPLEAPAEAVRAEADQRDLPAVDGVVRYLLDVRLDIDAEGRVTRTTHEVKQLVGRAAIEHEGALTVGWSKWHEERPTLGARVIARNGRAYHLGQEAITEGGGGRTDTVMFSDRRHLSAPLPAVAPPPWNRSRTSTDAPC